MPIPEQVMVITGTRKGIGRQLAEYYTGKGYRVFGCSRGPSDFDHPQYVHHCLDVVDEGAVKRLFRQVRQECGRLDYLINNAGIASMNLAQTTPVDKVRQLLDTNVVGTFLFSREAIKIMKKRRFGRIVNFSTIAVPLMLEGESIYAASKAAVVSFTEVLAQEIARDGITVNAIGPPPVDTDLVRGVPSENLEKRVMARLAIPRFASMEEIRHTLDYFLADEAAMITGQTVYYGGV